MLKNINTSLVTLSLSLILFSCSDQIQDYEEKIRNELEANNQTMSVADIKTRAIYLAEWSKPSFYQDAIKSFKENDISNPPLKNSILFIGSSSIVY